MSSMQYESKNPAQKTYFDIEMESSDESRTLSLVEFFSIGWILDLNTIAKIHAIQESMYHTMISAVSGQIQTQIFGRAASLRFP